MSVSKKVSGSCLCNKVGYEISGNRGIFQYCHCSRCRKFTGSAHAANLFVAPEDFKWTRGEEFIQRYEPEETRYFATVFCNNCGSSMPWLAKQGITVVIPAGTLDVDPGIQPTQNIFCASKASWYAESSGLVHHDELPKKRP